MFRLVQRATAAGIAVLALVITVVAGGTAAESAAAETARIQIEATANRTSVTPLLELGFTASRSDVIPADRIGYDATLTNTGARLAVSGTVSTSNLDLNAVTASAVSDYVEYFSVAERRWIPLAGYSSARPGYSPKSLPPVMTGLKLSFAGGELLGSTVSPGATSQFSYSARIRLTPSQVTFLLDSTKVRNIRNVIHVEAPAANSNAPVGGDTVKQMFTAQLATQSATARHAVVTVTRADESVARFDEGTDRGLIALAAGDSIDLTDSYAVPRLDAKHSDETDADYTSRLVSSDTRVLDARAEAVAAAGGAATLVSDESTNDVVVGSPRRVSPRAATTTSMEHVPVLTVQKDGPENAEAGSTVTYDIAVANAGSASGVPTATDAVGSNSPKPVAGIPLSLAGGDSVTGQVDVDIAEDELADAISDTASLSWEDANGNAYGPVTSTFTTAITRPNDAADTDADSDGVDLVAGDSLISPVIREVQGTKMLGGGCEYAARLVPPPGVRSVQATELDDDPETCTAQVEVAVSPASAVRDDIKQAIGMGVDPDAIPAVTTSRLRHRRARAAANVCASVCRSIVLTTSWTEDPFPLRGDLNKVWTMADWHWDGDKVVSGKQRDDAKATSKLTDWFLVYKRPHTVQNDEKISARTYAKFKNKDFVGCLRSWVYAYFSPNKALGFPNGSGDGRYHWYTDGALCRKLLHPNSRFTQIR